LYQKTKTVLLYLAIGHFMTSCFDPLDEAIVIESKGLYKRGTLTTSPGFPGTAGNKADFMDQFLYEPYSDQACQFAPPNTEPVELELRIFHHEDIPIEYRSLFTGNLERYFERHGINFVTRYESIPIPIDWIFEADEKLIEQHLQKEFPEIDFSEKEIKVTEEKGLEILQTTQKFILAPLLDFANVYGNQGEAIINYVLLPGIVKVNAPPEETDSSTMESNMEIAEETEIDDEETYVVGLALSPVLLNSLKNNSNSDEALFWQGLPIAESFTPMTFLDAGFLLNLITELNAPDVLIDLIAAHELGHDFGLTHIDDQLNLMSPSIEQGNQVSCQVTLNEEQTKTIFQTIESTQTPPSTLKVVKTDTRYITLKKINEIWRKGIQQLRIY